MENYAESLPKLYGNVMSTTSLFKIFMLKIISFFSFFVSIVSCGQNNFLDEKISLTRAKEHIQDSIVYIQKSIEFIRQVKEQELNDTTFKLSDKPFSFNTFSLPIFLRNYSYCIFYSDNHCGWLCGGGRLTLYKKINNRWQELKSYCNWIS